MPNSAKKIYFLAPALSLIIGLILFLIIIPAIKDIRELKKEITQQRFAIEKRYFETHNSKKTADLDKTKSAAEKLSSNFIKKDLELEFITALEKNALENNLGQEIKLQPAAPKLAGQIETVPIQISLKGNFIDFLKYLQNIEKLNYYININSINLLASSSKKENITLNQEEIGQINALIFGETYWEI